MAIEMAGGVYCPLSPRDPQHRLQSLLEQIQQRLVLVHFLTRSKFHENVVLFDIDFILTDNNMKSDIDIERLSNMIATSDNIAYIIFTSGSTGIPKSVSNKADIVHK